MEISDIKQRLSIHTTLQQYNIKPDRNNLIKCPFHEDHKPSRRIYPDTNTVYLLIWYKKKARALIFTWFINLVCLFVKYL